MEEEELESTEELTESQDPEEVAAFDTLANDLDDIALDPKTAYEQTEPVVTPPPRPSPIRVIENLMIQNRQLIHHLNQLYDKQPLLAQLRSSFQKQQLLAQYQMLVDATHFMCAFSRSFNQIYPLIVRLTHATYAQTIFNQGIDQVLTQSEELYGTSENYQKAKEFFKERTNDLKQFLDANPEFIIHLPPQDVVNINIQ